MFLLPVRSPPGAVVPRAGERQQLRQVAAVQRKIDDLLLLDDLGDRVVLGLDHVGGGLHLDGFGHRAQLQRNVLDDVLGHLQHDAGLPIVLEAFARSFQAIGPDGKVGKL